MKFIISNKVLIKPGGRSKTKTKKLLKKIRNDLTITNPAYQSQINMGLKAWGIDPHLQYYENVEQGVKSPIGVKVPIGALPDILEDAETMGIKVLPIDLTDCRISPRSPEFFSKFNFKGELRDHQKGLFKVIPDKTVGVIQAPTGSGKTVMFVYQVLNDTLNTMVMTHTKELAQQTIDAFINFSNLKKEDIGFVGSGEFNLKPITIALLQTVRSLEGKELKQMLKYFGQIITDETHIIAADTYYEAISKFPSKYKWGYSATPRRKDGLTRVIHWANGPLIYNVPRQDVKLIKPTYEKIYTDYYFPLFDTTEYQTMISHMAEDDKRNQQILDEFKKNKDIPSVFLCGRTSQVNLLHEQIPNSIKLTSKMTKKARKKAMEELKSKKKLHVVSTWNLFSTGIDVPHLQGMYICSPMRSENILRQGGGRLMRMSPGKDSAFIKDFIDRRVGLLAGQAKVRGRILSNL